MLLVCALGGCAGLWGQITQDMTLAVERGPSGVVGEVSLAGPELWTGDGGKGALLATDRTGVRVAISDGTRLAIWNAAARRLERVVPGAGHLVRGVVFAPQGDLMAIEESESNLLPGIDRLRLFSMSMGRSLAWMRLPCGCLVTYGFGDEGKRVQAVVSSAEIGGTWALSWSLEGQFLGSKLLSRRLVGAGDHVTFFEGGERVLWLRPDGGAPDRDVLVVMGLGERDEPARVIPVPSAASSLGCEAALRNCHRVVGVEGRRLMVATGRLGAEARATFIDLDAPEGAMNVALGTRLPLLWLPTSSGAARLLAQRPVAQEGQPDWEILALKDRQIEVEAGAPILPLPLVHLERGWISDRIEVPLRRALGLSAQRMLAPWFLGRARLWLDPRDGALNVIGPKQGWRWRTEGPPAVLPPIKPWRSQAIYDAGQHSVSGRPTVVAVGSESISLMAPFEPSWDAATQGGRIETLWSWSSGQGRVLEGGPLPDGRTLALVRDSHNSARLVALNPGKPTPREDKLTQEEHQSPIPVPPRSSHWSLWLDAKGQRGALLAITRKSDLSEASLSVRRFDPQTLQHDPRPTLINLPDIPTSMAVTWGSSTVLLPTRRRLTLVDLAGVQPEVFDWEPQQDESWWIKGVVALGQRMAVVRLVRQEMPADELWLTLEVGAAGQVKVLGHRRLTRVVATAAWAAGEQLHALEERGVLTTFGLVPGRGLVVQRVAYLDPDSGAFLALDADGQMHLPASGVERATAWRWLAERSLLPALLDDGGQVHRAPLLKR